MTIENTTQTKKQREKSALYPPVSISECYEFIKQVDSLGGKAVSYASILDLLGLTSPTTKSFLSRISASKQYGFITTGGSTVQLTDLAKHILYPVNGEIETRSLLIESFSNPPLYEKLIARFKDKAVPPKNQLSNILMNEYRIIKQVKDNAAGCFIDSASYLGLLKNGVLCFDEIEHDSSYKSKSSASTTSHDNIVSNENTISDHEESGYNFEIPTLGKKTAKFYIPDGVTEKDLDYIKLYIENMLPVFLDNLKSEIKQE